MSSPCLSQTLSLRLEVNHLHLCLFSVLIALFIFSFTNRKKKATKRDLGQFSLWAGGSVISLCQLLIYFVRLCYKNKRVRRLHLNCCSTAGVTSKKANHQHTPSATEISSTPDDFILTSTTVDGSQHAEPKHL